MQSSPVRILGVDPGYDRLGVCIIEKKNGKEILLFSDCIESSRKDSESARFYKMGNLFREILTAYKPDMVAMEKLFFVNNLTTGIAVANLCGVIKFLSEERGIPLSEYAPTQVKLAIASHGRANKNDVHAMVLKLITLSKKKRKDDEVDAIAVALTHSAHLHINDRLASTKTR